MLRSRSLAHTDPNLLCFLVGVDDRDYPGLPLNSSQLDQAFEKLTGISPHAVNMSPASFDFERFLTSRQGQYTTQNYNKYPENVLFPAPDSSSFNDTTPAPASSIQTPATITDALAAVDKATSKNSNNRRRSSFHGSAHSDDSMTIFLNEVPYSKHLIYWEEAPGKSETKIPTSEKTDGGHSKQQVQNCK